VLELVYRGAAQVPPVASCARFARSQPLLLAYVGSVNLRELLDSKRPVNSDDDLVLAL